MSDPILTKKQVQLSRAVLGGCIVLLAVFLLLCGAGVVGLPIKKAIIPAVFAAAGLLAFAWAIIQDSTLMLWLCPFLLTCAIASTVGAIYGYNKFYPIFIAAPAVASLFTAIVRGKWSYHVPAIAAFSVSSAIFMISSLGGVSLKIILPVLLIFIGVLVLIHALKHKKED